MKMPLLFAGRPEYQANLSALRAGVRPLSRELRDDLFSERNIARMYEIEHAATATRESLPNASAVGYVLGKAKLGALWLQDKALGAALFGRLALRLMQGEDVFGKKGSHLMMNDPDRYEAFAAEQAARADARRALSEVVTALRDEPGEEKAQWLTEFEHQQGRLSKLERFVLNEWTA